MTQQSIVKGDALQRISSAGFIIGAILFAASGLLMPHANTPTSDLREMLTPMGEYQYRTIVSSLFGMIGFWMALIGVTGVHRFITADKTKSAVLARLGFYFTLIGTTLWTVSWAMDVNTVNAVANWLSAPIDGKDAAWIVVATLAAFGRGILPTTWIIYWLALAFLNVAMLQSGIYPQWLGWAGLTVNIPMIALGVL